MPSNLFSPITVGGLELQHRVVLAPLTRFRATPSTYVPILPYVKDYYAQRGSRPGTLLITEGTMISPRHIGGWNAPGIWSEEQIAAWKQITDAVHAKGSFIFMQVFAFGRAADESALEAAGYSDAYVSSSDVQLTGKPNPPRAMTMGDIDDLVQDFVTVAKNAIKAGLDGVELHGANGYLVDQFIQDKANRRTDKYGGSIENRAQLFLEIVDAVSLEIGAKRVGIRISPWSPFQDMKMDDPIPQFAFIVQELRARHPDLAFLHVVEARVSGPDDIVVSSRESNDELRKIWAPLPYITAGGYTRTSAIETTEKNSNELVAFGRQFISNPDIVDKLEKDLTLTPYKRENFYAFDKPSDGYTDYAFHSN